MIGWTVGVRPYLHATVLQRTPDEGPTTCVVSGKMVREWSERQPTMLALCPERRNDEEEAPMYRTGGGTRPAGKSPRSWRQPCQYPAKRSRREEGSGSRNRAEKQKRCAIQPSDWRPGEGVDGRTDTTRMTMIAVESVKKYAFTHASIHARQNARNRRFVGSMTTLHV